MWSVRVSTLWFLMLILGYIGQSTVAQHSHGKSRCSSVPTVSKNVDKVIKECQEKIKVDLLEDVYKLATHAPPSGKDEWHLRRRGKRDLFSDEYDNHHDDHDQHHHHDDHHKHHDDNEFTHPTVISNEDKWIAGCLMHCVYNKNNAVDKYGWPTLDGLVDLYTDGVHEHGYFMAVLRGVDSCLKGTSSKYHVHRHRLPERGETCEISFDVFDCISDKITEYCSDHQYAK